MRINEFIRRTISNTTEKKIQKYRHVTVMATRTTIAIYDYDTKIAIADKISRIALVDAEHYTMTTAKTITYVIQVLLEQGFRVYRVPYVDDINNIDLALDHKYFYIDNEPAEAIIMNNEQGTETLAFIYNLSMLRKNLRNGAFLFAKTTNKTKKLHEYPEPELPTKFPIEMTPAEPPKSFEFTSEKPIPVHIYDFKPQNKLEKLDDSLFYTIDYLLFNNILKFSKFTVIDDTTIIVRRTGGLLKKTGDYEVIKFNSNTNEFRIITPKIEHISIPLLPSI